MDLLLIKILIECWIEGGRGGVWSSLEILSLSLFTPSNSIFDSQKKPNDSQDKFYFLSSWCRGFVPGLDGAGVSYFWSNIFHK